MENQTQSSCRSRFSSHHSSTPTSTTTRISSSRHRTSLKPLPLLVLLLSCYISLASANTFRIIEEQMIEEVIEPAAEDLGSALSPLAPSGQILVDLRPPPNGIPADWALPINPSEDLRRRDNFLGARSASEAASTTSSSTSAASTVVTSTIKVPSVTVSPTTVASSTSTSSSASAATTSSLPVPFDVGFNNNITDTCQSFMDTMLSNSTFKTCLPFSLLLQNSNSFFQASKSLVRITQTLDYSCSANSNTCSKVLSSFASNLTTSAGCSTDLKSENPQIQQALYGLEAYKTLYTASCLRDPSTSSYCFADAITNASSPTDSYIYFLPLNQSLVGGSQPTCNACLKSTMAVFESASSDRSSAIASTYVAAANQVNVNCGPGFVNVSLAAAVVSASPAVSSPISSMGIMALVVLMGSWLL